MNFDFNNFYLIFERFQSGCMRVDTDSEKLGIELFTGEVRIEKPIPFRYDSGTTPCDLIGTTYATINLFSDRIFMILDNLGFKGFGRFPAMVYDKAGAPLPSYSGLTVHGKCGPIDWSKGRHRRMPPRSKRGKEYDAWVGMYFDPATWDGSDIFAPIGTYYIVVTAEVKQALCDNDISNVRFTKLSEFVRDWPEPSMSD